MATDPNQFANVQLSDNFNTWRTRTNQIAAAMSSNTFTVANTLYSNGSVKAVTTGHGQILGSISVEEIYANTHLSGGELGNEDTLTIISNTHIEGRLSVANDAVFGLNGEEEVLLNSRLLVEANATFRATVRMDADVHIGLGNLNSLTVNSIARFNSNVHIDGDTISITGNTQIGGANTDTFIVNAVSTFDADVAFRDEVTLSANVLMSGANVVITGDTNTQDVTSTTLRVDGTTLVANDGSSTFTVGGPTRILNTTHIEDTLNVTGATSLNGTTLTTLVANGSSALHSVTATTIQANSTLDVNGATILNGAVTLGNATGDDLTFTGRAASSLVPKTDGVHTLGTTALRWEELFADAVTAGNTALSGTLDVDGATTINGAVSLGNATSDDLTFTGRAASSLVPKTDGVYSLGSNSLRWEHVYADDITAGNTSLSGALEVAGTTTLNGNITLGNAITDTITITGASEFNGTTTLDGAMTVTGASVLSGAVTLGDATADDLTFTGRVASSVIPKTTNTYSLGSSSLTYSTVHTGMLHSGSGNFGGNIIVSGNVAISDTLYTDYIQAAGLVEAQVGVRAAGFFYASGASYIGEDGNDTLEVAATTTFNNGVDFNGDQTNFTGNVAFTGEEVYIDSDLTVGSQFILTATEGRYANVNVSNTAIFEGNVVFGIVDGSPLTRVTFTSNVGSDILPHATGSYDLGSSTKKWEDIHSSGTINYTNMVASSSTGTVSFPKINSHFIPNTTNTNDLGSSTKQWKDVYIDGTGNIDTLITETATIANLTVPSEFMTIDSANVETYTRGRISVSDGGGDGSLSYNNTTGVITYTGPTAAQVRAHLSAGTSGTGFGGLTYSSSTGKYTYAKVTAANIRGNFAAANANNETTTFGGLSYNNGTYTLQKVGRQEVRGSISITELGGDGSLSYDEDTGVISYTGPGDTDTRGKISVSDGGGDGSLSYNGTTGVITYTGPSAAEVRNHFSDGTGVSISSGQISIGQAVGTTDSPTFAGQTINGTASMRSMTVQADSTYNIGTSLVKHATIYADTFDGTATKAKYADLAEKYLADETYATGTVVCVGGTAEVTASSTGMAHAVVGVVSENPAYMMNSDLEGGTYIALKGRVPVKIEGSVTKGAMLAAGPDGRAVEFNNAGRPFAIALEDGSYDIDAETGTDTIEAFIM